MESRQATFEIDSESDAHAVSLIMEQIYNSLREESVVVNKGEKQPNEMLDEFRKIRTMAEHESPGRLTIIYESYED